VVVPIDYQLKSDETELLMTTADVRISSWTREDDTSPARRDS
jgi:hypothetical protein